MDDTHYSISEAGKLVSVDPCAQVLGGRAAAEYTKKWKKSPVLYGASYSFISEDKRAEGKRISAESHRTGS